MVDKERNKCEQLIRYTLEQCNRKGNFRILNNICDHVTLLQLMVSLGNVNHSVSVVGKWIVDSNYEKALTLTI